MSKIGKKSYVLTFLAVFSSALMLVVLVLAATTEGSTFFPSTINKTATSLKQPENSTSIIFVPDDSRALHSPSSPSSSSDANPDGSASSSPTNLPTDPDNPLIVSEQPDSIFDPERTRYKIDHFRKLALQPLEFEVFDENGKAFKPDDLKVVHGFRMHFLVVSADLKEFQRLHPYFEKGKWKVLAYLPTPGTYYAYVDIAPIDRDPLVLRSELIVQRNSSSLSYPELTQSSNSSNNLSSLETNAASFVSSLTLNSQGQVINSPFSTSIELQNPHLLRQTTFTFTVSQNGKPAQLQTFMEALGHMVIIKHDDPDKFVHLHALDFSQKNEGIAYFATTFSKPGRYTAFAEFTINGRMYIFPITFDITQQL